MNWDGMNDMIPYRDPNGHVVCTVHRERGFLRYSAGRIEINIDLENRRVFFIRKDSYTVIVRVGPDDLLIDSIRLNA